MKFLKKIEEKIRRFTEVENALHSLEMAQDQARVRELGKEFRALEKIHSLYGDYLKVEEEMTQAEKIFKDKTQGPELQSLAEHEIATLTERRKTLVHNLEEMLIQDNPLYSKNVILEIRAGTGGSRASA